MELSPYLLQLVGVGFLWVSFHCVGMCGPIVASMNTAVSGQETRRRRLWEGALNILSYQSGRAVTYAILGLGAGWLGASIEGAVQDLTRFAALAIAAALVGAGLWTLPPVHRRLGAGTTEEVGRLGSRLGQAARRLSRLIPSQGRLRFVVFGAVMGLLPCMLMFWVLGLAASTADPLEGMLVMLGLIAMTTPVLIFAGTSPLLAGGFWQRHGEWVTSVAVIISGVWLGMIGAAANGWIEHVHLTFDLQGTGYTVMLW
jgi:hypothetical protein